jgi:hypothetical protein
MTTKTPSIYPMLDNDELQAAIRRAHQERSKALRSFLVALFRWPKTRNMHTTAPVTNTHAATCG